MKPTRRAERTWRKRLSRARWTNHPHRALIPLREGLRIGVWDPPDTDDETGDNDYPARVIRPPWENHR